MDSHIPVKKWGVGMALNGLGNSLSRSISLGTYTEMEFERCIILDFRVSRPQEDHPGS